MVSIAQIFIVTADSLYYFEHRKYEIIISECYEFALLPTVLIMYYSGRDSGGWYLIATF